MICGDFGVATDLVENVLGEPGGGPVMVGNTMNGGDSLALASSGEQKLGRFEKMKDWRGLN